MTRPKAAYIVTVTNDSDYPFRVKELATGGMVDFRSLEIAEAWIRTKVEGGISYDQRGNIMGSKSGAQ